MTNQQEQDIVGRLRKIEGQVRGIQRMIEESRGCESVLTQLLAVRTALDRVAAQVVTAKIEECLVSQQPEEAKAIITRAVQLLSRTG